MEDKDLLNYLYTNVTISITDFKKNPVAVVTQSEGKPIVVLSHNKPAFYCIPPSVYEDLMLKIKNIEEKEGD